ncbi:aldolase/citrate lyase family protein [Clostridium sp. AM58-1XD]|uniref:aldolase/citrate lyase family protein n=1 Tax=Clostridium sp. AM58-1XD TaxID=2292307 RepID=UPI001FA8CA5C|nr:aldolase/citrate lyase family protein [Clostridium sp. AM58-1XD]
MGFVNRRWVGNHCSMKQDEYAKMASRTVKVFMIEKKEAVDNIDEICSVPGVDMIQFGPNDFALSSGFNMAENMDVVREAERKVFEAAWKHGVQPRCEMNGAADAQYYLDLGIRHFNMGMELRILSNFWKEQGGQLNDLIRKTGLK